MLDVWSQEMVVVMMLPNIYRTFDEVRIEVLNAMGIETKIAGVARKCRLSHTIASAHINLLIKYHLAEKFETRTSSFKGATVNVSYKITDMGREYLRIMK